jgi:hypothetical protein
MAMNSTELKGMAASLRAMTADIEHLKKAVLGKTNSVEFVAPNSGDFIAHDSKDFFSLILGTESAASIPVNVKVSSLLILVEDLKPEEKKPRAAVTVKLTAQLGEKVVVLASQSQGKEGTIILPILACGLNSTLVVEIDGTAKVSVWGI